jgi:hypothetical protein
MHCDRQGRDYFEGIGLCSLWNEVKVTIPDDLGGINPKMFWAAGKLFALQAEESPVLMLDTDFIAWDLPELADSVIAAHREDLSPNVYPPISTFKMSKGYVFDDSMSYSPRPLNTAFLYMPDNDFKQYYIGKSFEFMRAAENGGDFLTYMVYAEQRLLAILAEYKRVKVNTLFELEDAHSQMSYTHTWGAKQVMRDNPSEFERFCEKCRARIRNDFPEWEWVIERIDESS